VENLKRRGRKVVALSLRQLLRVLREYPREVFLGALDEAARYGLYDLDRVDGVRVLVDGKPVRASGASAEWCLNAVNQCWTQKSARIRAGDLEEARRGYKHARTAYRKLMGECEE
jgi:hypothetical protein